MFANTSRHPAEKTRKCINPDDKQLKKKLCGMQKFAIMICWFIENNILMLIKCKSYAYSSALSNKAYFLFMNNNCKSETNYI